MKSTNPPFARFQALAIVLSLLLNCTFCRPISARAVDDLDYSDLTKLSSLETIVYGSSYKYLPSDKRIGSLEKILFGKTHSGPLHSRIFALATAINGPKNGLLSPPVAPELDHSDTATNTSAPPLAPEINSSDALSPSEAQEDRIKVMLQQAMQLYGQGQTAQAETILKKVIKLDSQNSDANFNLGTIAEGRSDWQSALHYYQAALKTNPTDNEIKNAIASMQSKIDLASRNNNNSSQNANQKLSAAQLESLKGKVDQAASDYQTGNYDAAISNLKTVLAQAPDQADVYFALAQAYKAKGQYHDASIALNQAIKLAPANQQYKDTLAEIASLNQQSSNTAGDTFASNNPDAANNSIKHKANKNKTRQDDWEEDTPNNQNNSGPVGEITPFSDQGNNQLGWQPTTQSYTGSSYYMPSLSSGYMPGYTYSNSIPYSMSSRIERAAITGLAGAAIGMFAGYAMRGGGRRW